MQSTYKIPDGAAELLALSPTEWFALKNHIVREARFARAAVLRAAFSQVVGAARRGVHNGQTTAASLLVASRSRPQSGHL